MRDPSRRLVREIVLVVVAKLLALTGLWFAFIDGRQVAVDGDAAATRLLKEQGTHR